MLLARVWGRRGGAKTWTTFSERAARTRCTAERASFSWRANNGRRLKSIGSARRRPRGAVSGHIGIYYCINRMMCAYHTVHNNNVRYSIITRGVNAFWDLFHHPGAGGLPCAADLEGLFDAAAADFYYTLVIHIIYDYILYYVGTVCTTGAGNAPLPVSRVTIPGRVFAGRAVQFSFSTPFYIFYYYYYFFLSFLFSYSTVIYIERVNLILQLPPRCR